MKFHFKIFLVLFFFIKIEIYAQNAFEGKLFIFNPTNHTGLSTSISRYKIKIFAKENSTIKISNSFKNFLNTLTLNKDSVIIITLDTSITNFRNYYGKTNNNVLIESTGNIIVTHSYNSAINAYDQTLILPLENGSDYYHIMNSKNIGNEIIINSLNDSNLIELNIKDTVYDSNIITQKYRITLNKYETYHLYVSDGFSGSSIKCLNPQHKITIMSFESGDGYYFKNNMPIGSFVPYISEYILPNKYHGKKFYVAPYILNNSSYRDLIRVSSEFKGEVTCNGRKKTIKSNTTDTFFINEPSVIESNIPIQVSQITPPNGYYPYISTIYPSLSNQVCWKQRLNKLNIITKDNNSISTFSLIYPKKDRNKLRIKGKVNNLNPYYTNQLKNGITLDSLFYTHYRVFIPFPSDTSMEICGIQDYNLTANYSNLFLESDGEGFLANVWVNESSTSFISYNPGFKNKKLDIDLKINQINYFENNENDTPNICNQLNEYECFTNYKSHAWRWLIEDSIYYSQKVKHKMRDTGIHKITMIATRFDSSKLNSNVYVSDTVIRFIKIYQGPYVKFNKDTLNLCDGDTLTLNPNYYTQNKLLWGGDITNLSCTNCNKPFLNLYNSNLTFQKIICISTMNGCINYRDTLFVNKKDKFNIVPIKDTLLCYGQDFNLNAKIKGGDSNNYSYFWLNNGDTVKVNKINLKNNTIITLKASDNCTKNILNKLYFDSIQLLLNVREPIEIFNFKDTQVCINSNVSIKVKTKGGNKNNYILATWLNDNSNDTLKQLTINKDTQLIVKVEDGCSENDTASILIKTFQPLKLDQINDQYVCINSIETIPIKINGGDTNSNYINVWLNSNFFKADSFKSNYQININTNIINDIVVKTNQSCNGEQDSFKFKTIPDTLKSISNKLNDTICEKSFYDFIFDISSFKPYNINYKINDDSQYSNNFNLSLVNGKNVFKLNAENGCSISFKDSLIIYNNKKSNVKLDYSPYCFKDTLKLFSKIYNGNKERYKIKWIYENQKISEDSTFSFNTLNKTSKVYYTLTDNCSDTIFDSIILIPTTIAKYNIVEFDACLKSNKLILLNKSDTFNTQFNWTIPNTFKNNSFNKDSIIGSFNQSGNHQIILNSISKNICKDSAIINLKIFEKPKLNFNYIRTTNTYDKSTWRFNQNNTPPLSKVNWEFIGYNNDSGHTVFKEFYTHDTIKTKLSITDLNGCNNDTFFKFYLIHRLNYFIPNAISNNQDGINDKFTIQGAEYIKEFDIKIFNRWGEMVFKSFDPYFEWFPNDNSNNIYIYTITLFDQFNERHVLKGVVEIIN